ncbi:prolyl 4-hydroxylase [Croceifilum oryzae]|uniref:Prolyl 4-hydroxylase n=1 Tax=Croceifilum oryzae TaxID=1553429 RepID=A0AAJ1TJY1_9BACL|nr:2OG-Fe(II) oxygenase [Croceifilum oryzae]MDQ0417424.1 prolyl 4-hydroxylase [Croceifilum oryzae]
MEKLVNVLSTDPYVVVHEEIFSQEECQHIINVGQGVLAPAQTQGGMSDTRISDTAWLNHYTDHLILSFCERIANLVGRPLSHAEALQVARYGVGGKFEPHIDCYDTNSEGGNYFFSIAGQRICTAILYLNDTLKGGETYFPDLNLDIKPKTGNLLIFDNCYTDTINAHPLSIHGSRVLEEGEKWITTLWFTERPHY